MITRSSILCDVCGQMTIRSFFPSHYQLHEDCARSECSKCGFIGSPNSRECHIALTHDKNIKTFEDSFIAFVKYNNGKLKRREDSLKKIHICLKCKKSYASLSALNRHIREHAYDFRSAIFRCGECHTAFTTPQKLKRHCAIHLNDGDFECKCCGKHFSRREVFRDHQRRAHAIYRSAPLRTRK
jgi:KRAB domain-containing zinc finger protein